VLALEVQLAGDDTVDFIGELLHGLDVALLGGILRQLLLILLGGANGRPGRSHA
jgi:hypothetical protein